MVLIHFQLIIEIQVVLLYVSSDQQVGKLILAFDVQHWSFQRKWGNSRAILLPESQGYVRGMVVFPNSLT